MNCAPNTLSEFPGAQECFISQFISPVCLCFFIKNFLPTEVHFWVRIPVKMRGIHSGRLVVSMLGRISASVGKHWAVGSEINCLERSPRAEQLGPCPTQLLFSFTGTVGMSNMKGRAKPAALCAKATHQHTGEREGLP